MNAAITSTGQREFHSGAEEQSLSLDFLHDYLMGNYRDLYAATLALDVNDHNAVLIARNLLATAGEADLEQRRAEGRLIARRLALLPPPRVYGLFPALRHARVNNRRTRAIMRDWLAARPDLAFDAVKYRGAVKSAVRHAHLSPDGELGPFLFTPHRQAAYTTPILETWRRAHYEQAALYELPYTVAEGFAAKHRVARATFRRAHPRRPRTRTRTPRHRLRRMGQLTAGARGRGAADLAHPARPGPHLRRRAPQPGVRWLAPTVPTAGIRDAENLVALVEPAGPARVPVGEEVCPRAITPAATVWHGR